MSTVNKVIITTIIIIAVVLGAWWVIASMSANTNESSNGSNENNQADQEVAATIMYNGSEFTPPTTTIHAGDSIKIVNDSQNVLYFASNEHPTHLDNSELNVGDIEPGASATFAITKSGTWGYHDHHNASAGGEIIVE